MFGDAPTPATNDDDGYELAEPRWQPSQPTARPQSRHLANNDLDDLGPDLGADLDDAPSGWAASSSPMARSTSTQSRAGSPANRTSPASAQPEFKLRKRTRGYLFFVLTLVPLILFSLFKSDDLGDRLQQTLETNKSAIESMEQNKQIVSLGDVLDRLPDGRIQGAHLAHDTLLHWFYALVSAVAFLGLIHFLFDQGNSEFWHLLVVGLFTSTIGIVSLLLFQVAANYSSVLPIRGNVAIIVLILIVKFIGFSYHSALDNDAGFLLSFLGFTFGVGLCEELTKMIPVMFKVNGVGRLNWRGACVWGLASGVGFGVAEGIMYSADHYNGMATGGIYVVRFVSCVGLHAMWAAAAAIMLYHKQELFDSENEMLDWLLAVLRVLAVPMVLHALYDTLLKMEYEWLALLTAVASFAWLIYLIEQAASAEAEKFALVTSRFRTSTA